MNVSCCTAEGDVYNMAFTLSIIVGGLITIATAMAVEYFRRPKLALSIEAPPCDVPYAQNRPANNARHLRLKLRNEALPRGLRWMQRAAALQCRGEITFHHLDGQNIFGRQMPVRWANSPQPIASQIVDTHGVTQYVILDFTRMASAARMDVYPGDEEIVDVAVRFDDETDCYGWNDEAYIHQWRNPDWKLARDRYLVKVVITSSGDKCIGCFRLINDVDKRTDFRLEPAKPEDTAKLI
jgi:hypothetical protein